MSVECPRISLRLLRDEGDVASSTHQFFLNGDWPKDRHCRRILTTPRTRQPRDSGRSRRVREIRGYFYPSSQCLFARTSWKLLIISR